MPPLVIFHNPPAKGAPRLPYVLSRDVRFLTWRVSRLGATDRDDYMADRVQLTLRTDGSLILTLRGRAKHERFAHSFPMSARVLSIGYMHRANGAAYEHRFGDNVDIRLANAGRAIVIESIKGEPLFAWYPRGEH